LAEQTDELIKNSSSSFPQSSVGYYVTYYLLYRAMTR